MFAADSQRPQLAASLFAETFDLAPVSMWMEDFSGVKHLFDQWRREGVTDLYSHLLDSPLAVQQCVERIKVLQVNRRTVELFKAADAAELIERVGEILRDDMFESHVMELLHLWSGALHFAGEAVNYDLHGRRLNVRFTVQILAHSVEPWDRVLVCLENVTDRVTAEQARAQAEHTLHDLFEHSPVSLWLEDYSGVRCLLESRGVRIGDDVRRLLKADAALLRQCLDAIGFVDVNQRTAELFGVEGRDGMLQQLGARARIDMLPHATEHLAELWDGKYREQHEVVCTMESGAKISALMESSVLPGHERDWRRVLVALVDITSRKAAEARAAYLGSHDALTVLGNRARFERIRSEICEACAWPVTILVADLNGLKDANDLAGHRAGDALIVRAAALLQKAIVAPAAAFRTGGDEFVAILPQTDEGAAQILVTQVNQAIEADNTPSRAHVLGLSLGHATCRAQDDWDDACHLADQRMYAAKRQRYLAAGQDRRRSGGFDATVARPPMSARLFPQDSH